MSQPPAARPGALATFLRWRAPLVIVPLVVALVVAGAIGARMLWAEIPPKPTAAPLVTCWNGVEAAPERCGQPTGAAGLKYVFPGFRPHGGRCAPVHHTAPPGKAVPVEWTCRLPLEAQVVTIVYSERTSLTRGLQYIGSTYPGTDAVPSASGARLTWRGTTPNADGLYDLVEAYAHFPYSVTVAASTPTLRDRALGDLVRFRPPDDMTVRRHPPPAS